MDKVMAIYSEIILAIFSIVILVGLPFVGYMVIYADIPVILKVILLFVFFNVELVILAVIVDQLHHLIHS